MPFLPNSKSEALDLTLCTSDDQRHVHGRACIDRTCNSCGTEKMKKDFLDLEEVSFEKILKPLFSFCGK